MSIGILILSSLYTILMVSFVFGFRRVKTFRTTDFNTTTKFSIVIPFRNEAANLPLLLDSILSIAYPWEMFEVVLVDDNSSDNSVEIIEMTLTKAMEHNCSSTANIHVIKNKRRSPAPKKDAIETAIQVARYEWILTTDADCVLPESWLRTMDAFIRFKQPKMVIAPVSYKNSNTFLGQFQFLDFLSLQSATISGFGLGYPFLCNGANFAYQKSFYHVLKGFEGNTQIVSGDDIFLLEKAIKAFPKEVHYLKSLKALVITEAASSFGELFQQRKRWVAKMSFSKNYFGKITGFIVILMNALIIVTTLLALTGIIQIKLLFLVMVLKFALDFIHVYQAAEFFKMKLPVISFAFSSLLYPYFSVLIGVSSFLIDFKWKDRRFRK